MPTNFLNGSRRDRMAEVHPLLQVLFGTGWLLVFPEKLEGFFQVVGADDGRVPAHQRGKTFFLIGGQIPGILQQQPAAALESALSPWRSDGATLRRTSSTASFRCLTIWKRSNRICALGACSRTSLA